MAQEPDVSLNTPLRSFLFPKKIGRVSYFIRLLMMILILQLVAGYYLEQLSAEPKLKVFFVLLFVPMVLFYAVAFIIIPRARSFGMPVWMVLFLLIPLLGQLFAIVLLVCPEGSWQKFREGAKP